MPTKTRSPVVAPAGWAAEMFSAVVLDWLPVAARKVTAIYGAVQVAYVVSADPCAFAGGLQDPVPPPRSVAAEA